MRNKVNHLPLTDFFSQAQLHFNVPNFSTFSPAWAVQGGWRIEGLQPVHISSSLLLLPLYAFPVFWCGSLALWSFTNCEGSFPWAKVQQDKPASAWGLYESWQENLLLCGLLSMGCSACQEPLHRLQVPSGHICPLQSGLFHELQRGFLLWCDLFYRLQGNICSGTWSTFSLSFFPDLGVCRIVSLAVFGSLPMQHFALS